jgi:multiple sugar transport system permease protein
MVKFPFVRSSHHIRSGSPVYDIVSYILALFYAFIIAVPIYFVFISSLKTNREIFSHLLALPSKLDFFNFISAQQYVNLFRSFLVSAGVTVSSVTITLLLAFPVAYAIARIPTHLSGVTEAFFATGLLIPTIAMLLPTYLLIVKLGLINNPLALVIIFPAQNISVTVIILAAVLRTIPHEMEESAEMDGANRLQVIWYIFLPLASAGLVSVGILAFLSMWNEYLFAFTILNNQNRTIMVAIQTLHSNRVVDYGLISAGAVIGLLPIYIVFILFQERIMSGLLAGALKE